MRTAPRLLVLCVTALLGQIVHGNESGAVVVRSAMEMLSSIDSYRFVAKEVATYPGGVPDEVSREFLQAGDMFKVETIDSAPGTPSLIHAFDGKRYQNYSRDHDVLSFSAENRFPTPYGAVHPILLSFMWALSTPDGTWADLKSASVRSQLEKDAVHIGQRTIDGVDCEVLRFPGGETGPEQEFTVFFAKSLNYYPVRVECDVKEAGATWVIQASDFTSREVDEGQVYIPRRVSSQMPQGKNGIPPASDIEWQIAAESIEVNMSVPEHVFTLSHDIASNVDDYDANSERLIREGLVLDVLDRRDAQNIAPRAYRLLLILTPLLVLAFAARLLVKSKNARI